MPTGGGEKVSVPFSRPLYCKGFDESDIALKLLEKVIEESWETEYLFDVKQFDFVLNHNLMLPNEKVSFVFVLRRMKKTFSLKKEKGEKGESKEAFTFDPCTQIPQKNKNFPRII